MQDKSLRLITPHEKHFLFVKEKLAAIYKPIITINGRNLKKIPLRNITLYKHIHRLISMGAYVINLTDYAPGFVFPPESYCEVPSIQLGYSETVAYFLNSRCLVSVGNAAGISTHLLTPANILILNNSETWVDNPRFAYNELTLVAARKTYSGFTTLSTPLNYLDRNESQISDALLESAIHLPKPVVINFFSPTYISL